MIGEVIFALILGATIGAAFSGMHFYDRGWNAGFQSAADRIKEENEPMTVEESARGTP